MRTSFHHQPEAQHPKYSAIHKLPADYPIYYNDVRTHRSLDKDAPAYRPVQQIGSIRSHALLGGLHHHYVRV